MKINVNEITLFYEKIGQGEPLIFVHGNQEDHQIFFELAYALKDHFTCYLFDSRNHGQSSKTDDFQYAVMARDYLDAIHQLKLENPYFLGYSDGGIIGLLMALIEPKILKKMIICGANIHPLGIMKNERKKLRIEYEIDQNPYLKMMLDQPNIPMKKLHDIRIPIMLISGEFDVILKRHTLAMHRHIPRSELMIMQKKHHDDYIVHRDDLRFVITKFLD
ncbi:MAG: alpha/beta fold hydrolase [Acholeplasma sp.]|nr:MAG: alpha/beta fold hydrolase [Acholeplasma sp.]